MKTKKVAFCFSGQARTLDLCYPYIKNNLLDPLGKNKKDYDIFCCVENDEDAYKVNILNPVKTLRVSSTDFSKEVKNLLKSNQDRFFCRTTNNWFNNHLNQLKKIFLSNKLREEYQKANKIKYDWVFRIRFDIFPLNKVDYPNLNPKYLYSIQKIQSTELCCNDMIALSSEKNLNIYSDQINNITETIELFFLKQKKVSWKISFFLEKIYTSFFEFFIKRSKKRKFFYKLLHLMIGLKEFIFVSPPQGDTYFAESGLFRYLKKRGIKNKILPIDCILVREKRIHSVFISPR